MALAADIKTDGLISLAQWLIIAKSSLSKYLLSASGLCGFLSNATLCWPVETMHNLTGLQVPDRRAPSGWDSLPGSVSSGQDAWVPKDSRWAQSTALSKYSVTGNGECSPGMQATVMVFSECLTVLHMGSTHEISLHSQQHLPLDLVLVGVDIRYDDDGLMAVVVVWTKLWVRL